MISTVCNFPKHGGEWRIYVFLSQTPFQLSLVGQEPVLYARSIFENIGYGIENPTLDDAIVAAKQANADGFIQDLKEKYETQAGEKGMQLSGIDNW